MITHLTAVFTHYRLADTDEPARARGLSVPEVRQIVGANCFPRATSSESALLVPRQSTVDRLDRHASVAIWHIAASVLCIEVSFGVNNPVSDLTRTLAERRPGDQRSPGRPATPFGDGTASSRVVQGLPFPVRRQPPTLHRGAPGVSTQRSLIC